MGRYKTFERQARRNGSSKIRSARRHLENDKQRLTCIGQLKSATYVDQANLKQMQKYN